MSDGYRVHLAGETTGSYAPLMAERAEPVDLIEGLDLQAYAELTVALSAPRVDEVSVLRAHDLDEEGWERANEAWQDRLSEAEHAFGDQDGVPPLLEAYGHALQQAQERRAGDLLSLERYATAARALATGRDLDAHLERLAITLADFLHAHAHWTKRAASDAALAAKLARLMS